MLDRTNRALLLTVLALGALLVLRLGQQAMTGPPGFATETFDASMVSLMSVCDPQGCVAFRKDERGRWEFDDEAEREPVDQRRVLDVLGAWAPGLSMRFKAEDVLRGPSSPVIGTESGATVTLRIARAPDDEVLSVGIGGEAPSGGHFVQRAGDRAVYVMDVPLPELLVSDRLQWLDFDAWKGEARKLERFEILNRHGRLAFERDEESWRATEPAELEVDPRALDRLLDAVGALSALPRAQRETSDKAREAGLDRPRISVTTHKRGATSTLHLGGESDDGAHVFVDREGAPVLFLGKPESFARLDVSADQIRDVTLLSLPEADGWSMTWRRGDRAAHFVWQAGSWTGESAPNGLGLAIAALQPLRDAGARERSPEGEHGAELVVEGPDGTRRLQVWPESDGVHPATLDGHPVGLRHRVVERLDSLLP